MVAAASSPDLRRFPFRLPHWGWFLITGVLLVVFVAGLTIGLPTYRRNAATETLRRHGAGVATEPVGPSWLRQCIGDDYMRPFDDVTFVATYSSAPLRPGDAEMPAIQQLTHLQTLSLNGATVTDAGLKYLNSLSNLSFLDLRRTRVTDAGVMHLKGLKSLKELDLRHTAVSDAGIANLKRELPMLEINGP